MRLNVAQTEWMIGHVTKWLRLWLLVRHKVGIIRMSGNIAAIMRMARDGANQSGIGFGKFRMCEFWIIRMARIVAKQHGVTGNAARWQSFILIRRRVVVFKVWIIRMFWDIAFVGRMSWNVADSVLKRSG